MAILVTGGAGFIGSHVTDHLLARGETVVVVDDLNNYYNPARKDRIVAQHRAHPKYTFVKADIRDKHALQQVFASHNITSIIHLAARAGVRPSIADPELYMTTNVLGTLYLLDLAKQHHVQQFVFASSSSVYGNSAKPPFSEDQKVDEPISPYAASKKAGENICFTYSKLYGLPVTCLRFFTVYGPRGRPDMAPFMFLDKVHRGQPIDVFGDGSSSRDFTYVGDIVSGILAVHDNPRPYEVVNLGNSSPVKLSEFIAIIERVTGKEAIRVQKPMQPGDVDLTFADITKAKTLYGYQPTTSFEVGIRKAYEWYLQEIREGRL